MALENPVIHLLFFFFVKISTLLNRPVRFPLEDPLIK